MDLQHLERLRLQELEGVIGQLRPGDRVLEIGAGSGFQARALAARGFEVEAIDLAHSPYAAARVFPVRDYDGRTLPFPDASFDLIFSSNVLEHVPHVEQFLRETRRVLRPDRRAVHVLPTSTWRVWTTLSLHPLLAKLAVKRLVSFARPTTARSAPPLPGSGSGRFRLRMLVPSRHGEHGNAWTEVWLFSRYRWRALFRRTRFAVAEERPSRLFYTGSSLLGDLLGLPARRRLSRILGSSSRIWVLS
jgi:SAM-dependent methyltransferase